MVRGLRQSNASVLQDQNSARPGTLHIGSQHRAWRPKTARSIGYMQGRLARTPGIRVEDFLDSPQPVFVLNDAHAALLGEVWQGAAKGYRNVVLLTLGTGVGGAVLVDGHLVKGHIGRAGHLGHVSVNSDGRRISLEHPGSLEADDRQLQHLRALRKVDSNLLANLSKRTSWPRCDATRIWLRSMSFTSRLRRIVSSTLSIRSS
jgi:hypothetical protein